MERIGTLETVVDDVGNGPTILLVHGIVETKEIWKPTMAVFSDDYRFITYNTRGHGGAIATDDDYSIDAYAGDIKNIIDKYTDDPLYLVGHSFGCVHIQRFLQKYEDQVDNVLLFQSSAQSPKFSSHPQPLERLARYKRQSIRREFKRNMLKPLNMIRPEAPIMIRNNPKWIMNAVDQIKVPKGDVRDKIKEALKFDYTDDNSRITNNNVTVAGGLRDEVVRVEDINVLNNSIHHSELEWINSGHMSMFFPPYFDIMYEKLEKS